MDVLHKDPLLEVYRLRLGPYDNNAYVIIDPEARRAAIIDAPPEGEAILDVVRPHAVDHILITHEHPDHIMTLGLLRDATGAKVHAHEDETNVPGELIDARLRHGDVLQVGRHEIRVVHTPGHTPGSVSFVLGDYLFSGDTLFPGGPGASRSPEALRQEIRSIT
ncbi:MAG TPA: MBL fold metallo-hydrolase, partial [Dehalococcoidia bacterium]|nr:MBL fold metallo-hydrolase [Dehalococcoidia bacterium]